MYGARPRGVCKREPCHDRVTVGWRVVGVGQLLLSSVINIPRKARGPDAGDGARPAAWRPAAVPGVPVRRFPAVLLALLLSGDVGVGLAQSARVPVSNIDDGFSGSGPLGVGR